MTRLEISGITGEMPINVYVSDYYGNNKTFLGVINSPVPPSVFYFLPETFDDAPMVKLILIDIGGCESNHNIVCIP